MMLEELLGEARRDFTVRPEQARPEPACAGSVSTKCDRRVA